MVIRLLTRLTPCMSLTSLATRSFSAAFLSLPPTVTTPRFVVTVVLRALVERWNNNAILTWAVMEASSIFSPTVRVGFFDDFDTVSSLFTPLTPSEDYGVEYWPLERYKLTLAPPPRELAGRIALVTGAASGIGKAIAIRFAQEGAHVAVNTHPGGKHSGAEVIADILRIDPSTIAVPANVDNRSEVEAMIQQIVAKFGRLDVLINNAGSLLTERLSGHKVEIGLVPFGSIGLSWFVFDLFLASRTLLDRVKDTRIHAEVLTSDKAPKTTLQWIPGTNSLVFISGTNVNTVNADTGFRDVPDDSIADQHLPVMHA